MRRPLLKLFEWYRRLQRMPLCHLTTVGARSGVERTVPLRPFPGGPGRWLGVASLGGAARNPAWLRNLAAHPDRVTVRVGRRTHRVVPHTLAGADRERDWRRIVSEAPSYAAYQEQTDLPIPVVRLTTVEGGPHGLGRAN